LRCYSQRRNHLPSGDELTFLVEGKFTNQINFEVSSKLTRAKCGKFTLANNFGKNK